MNIECQILLILCKLFSFHILQSHSYLLHFNNLPIFQQQLVTFYIDEYQGMTFYFLIQQPDILPRNYISSCYSFPIAFGNKTQTLVPFNLSENFVESILKIYLQLITTNYFIFTTPSKPLQLSPLIMQQPLKNSPIQLLSQSSFFFFFFLFLKSDPVRIQSNL